MRLHRLLAAAALLAGCSSATGPGPNDHLGAFDRYWETFDRVYPMFPLKGVDWKAQRAAFRPRAEQATSTDQLVTLLREMTEPLHDVHTGLVDPDGRLYQPWTPTATINWDRPQWLASLGGMRYTQVKPNLGHGTLPGGIAYVVFGGWNRAQFDVADVDRVLDEVSAAPALVVDVRMNGGGSDALAFAAAGRFLTQRRSAGTVQVRDGASYTSLGPPQSIQVSPRGPRLTMPVVVLTGRGIFSSNEEFVDVMRQEPQVTTMGDTTGGGSGNPQERQLYAGWKFRVPTWLHLASDGEPIEGRGIAPERYAAWDAAAARAGRDVVLEAAVAWLQGLRPTP